MIHEDLIILGMGIGGMAIGFIIAVIWEKLERI